MKQILTSLALMLAFAPLFSQDHRTCGAADHFEQMKDLDPSFERNQESIERFTENFVTNGAHTRAVVTIPVVFHIVHNGDAVGSSENISDVYINAQLQQLNDDFRKLNSDRSQVPSIFSSLHADTEIQFCLASRAPDGTATTGINRMNGGKSSWTMSQIESSLKPSTIWNRDKYLNVWTVIFGGNDAGTLGYAQFPGGAANTDGVVFLYSSLGSISTPNPAGGAYGKGRTATHEVGHWLNLRHIWGDGTCATDYVNDTPTHNTANYGCPTYPHASTCSGAPTEMTMNYMDYTDDACMYMFTAGQKARMQAVLTSGGARASLATSDGCSAPGGGTSCGTPSGLSASSITSSSATVSWGAVSGATSYNLQYKVSTASTWTTASVTSTSASFSSLAASTTYNFQVQAVCGSTTGSYSSAASFATLASGGGGTSCTDTYESNNSKSTAKSIAKNTTITATISSGTDVDWYKFTTTTSSSRVKVELTNLPADYDMKLYRSNTLIGTSQNDGTASETLTYNTTKAYTYYVYVYGYGGANSTSCYSLKASTSNTNFRGAAGNDGDIVLEKAMDVPFIIMPNPTQGETKLAFTLEQDENVDVTVFNAVGKSVFNLSQNLTKGSNEVALQFNDMPNGIYFVRATAGSKSTTQRIVVQR
jgi:hypothetical protein